jgi:hypothetical protein
MFRTPTLLAITVTLAMPTLADTPSKPHDKTAINAANKKANTPIKKGWIQMDSLQFGASRTNNNPVGATGKETGQTNGVSGLHGTAPAGAVVKPAVKNPSLTDPCKAPNPPLSCKQSKPAP